MRGDPVDQAVQSELRARLPQLVKIARTQAEVAASALTLAASAEHLRRLTWCASSAKLNTRLCPYAAGCDASGRAAPGTLWDVVEELKEETFTGIRAQVIGIGRKRGWPRRVTFGSRHGIRTWQWASAEVERLAEAGMRPGNTVMICGLKTTRPKGGYSCYRPPGRSCGL